MTQNYDKRAVLYARAVTKGERTLESIKNPTIRAEVDRLVKERENRREELRL